MSDFNSNINLAAVFGPVMIFDVNANAEGHIKSAV